MRGGRDPSRAGFAINAEQFFTFRVVDGPAGTGAKKISRLLEGRRKLPGDHFGDYNLGLLSRQTARSFPRLANSRIDAAPPGGHRRMAVGFSRATLFRHKTSKRSYKAVFWLIVILQQFAAFDSLQDWKSSSTALAFTGEFCKSVLLKRYQPRGHRQYLDH